jgi:integrase
LNVLKSGKPFIEGRAEETVKYLESNELQRLFRVIKAKRDLAIFRTAYHYGCRASEITLLQLSDLVDVDGQPGIRIQRLKGGKTRAFPLLPAVLVPLRAWVRERGELPGPLFRSRKGVGIQQPQLHRLMRRYCGLAGIAEDKAHFHTLRHSCATSLIDLEQALEYVQHHLGHNDIRSTQVYAKVSGKKQREVMKRLRDWK